MHEATVSTLPTRVGAMTNPTTSTIELYAHLPPDAYARLDEAPGEPRKIGSATTLRGVQRLCKRAETLHREYTKSRGNWAAHGVYVLVMHPDGAQMRFAGNDLDEPSWVWLYASDPQSWRALVEDLRVEEAERRAQEDALLAQEQHRQDHGRGGAT